MQTLKMISDTRFESMGLAIGHVGKRKALTAEISGAQISEGMLRLWGSLLKAYKYGVTYRSKFSHRKINFRVGNQLTGSVIVGLFQTSSLSAISRV